MKRDSLLKLLLFCVAIIFVQTIKAEEACFEIVEYNKDADRFTLKSFGKVPSGSSAEFHNEYGATTGNRYNQIPRNKSAAFYLYGWQGCIINSITFNMCSNNAKGSLSVTITANDIELYKMPTIDFNDENWYGEWVSKDLGIYVDITKTMSTQHEIKPTEDIEILIKGGTQEGSVYINRITIDYTPINATTTSPMGYQYTKLTKNSSIEAGDVVILYRNGYAASDIDTLVANPYMDVYGVANTSNVYEPELMYFTLGKDEGKWTFTNQYNQKLGAKKEKHLVWDSANTTWDITLTYEGAEIANCNANCGTIRYNAPAESYARFSNYTSKTLQLPFLYKRIKQNEQTKATSIQLNATSRTLKLCQDTAILKATFTPKTTTDQRLTWEVSDESIATVRNGIIKLLAIGTTIVYARTTDGSDIEASCTINVVDCESALDVVEVSLPFQIENNTLHFSLVKEMAIEIFTTNGQLITSKKARGTFQITLKSGIYIVRIGEQIIKITI